MEVIPLPPLALSLGAMVPPQKHVVRLAYAFKTKPNPTTAQLRKLAKAIDMPLEQVRTWFINRRMLQSMMEGKAAVPVPEQRDSKELSNLILAAPRTRTPRCGECEGCIRDDCGKCISCNDKPKFGGPGVRKQGCELRRCVMLGTDSPKLVGQLPVVGVLSESVPTVAPPAPASPISEVALASGKNEGDDMTSAFDASWNIEDAIDALINYDDVAPEMGAFMHAEKPLNVLAI